MRYIVNLIAVMFLFSGCTVEKNSSIYDISKSKAGSPSPLPTVVEDQEFQSVTSGRAESADGTPFSFHLYKSSDSRSISTRLEMRGSPASAERELHRIIRSAVEVLEQGPKVDKNGLQVGQRAVLNIKPEQAVKAQVIVLWNEGSQLHIIESASLQDALEFEKRYSPVSNP